jgi:hypothetical protein
LSEELPVSIAEELKELVNLVWKHTIINLGRIYTVMNKQRQRGDAITITERINPV